MKKATLCRKNYRTWHGEMAIAAIMVNCPVEAAIKLVEVLVMTEDEIWFEATSADTQNGEPILWSELPRDLQRRVRSHRQRYAYQLNLLLPVIPVSCEGCDYLHGEEIVCALHPEGLVSCADYRI